MVGKIEEKVQVTAARTAQSQQEAQGSAGRAVKSKAKKPAGSANGGSAKADPSKRPRVKSEPADSQTGASLGFGNC